MGSTTLYYASDVHGSDRCFRKFLNAAKFYKANTLVMGGDILGKAIIFLQEVHLRHVDPGAHFLQEYNGLTQDVAAHHQRVGLVEFCGVQKFAKAAVRAMNIACIVKRRAAHQLTIPGSSSRTCSPTILISTPQARNCASRDSDGTASVINVPTICAGATTAGARKPTLLGSASTDPNANPPHTLP